MIEEENNVDIVTEDPAEPVQPAAESDVPDQAPVQVISVDELIDRLTAGSESEDPEQLPEEGTEDTEAETEPEEPSLQDQYFQQALEDNSSETTVQLLSEIRDALPAEHPFLTTDFADYSVSEGLLLSLLLCIFVKTCVTMLRRGFSWLL